MRNTILQDKIDEAVTHYINVHPDGEPIPIDANEMSIPVQDDGGRVVMHQQAYPTMCRQVSVGDQVVEGPWNEELLDEGRIAAIVAHLAQNQRTSHHHPPTHTKMSSVRNVVDTSVILDGTIRFNGQVMDQQTDSIVVDLPPMQTLPPLQNMKRCQETDWFNDKNKKNDTSILTDSDSQVLELNPGASPVQNKQHSKKSLPHKKRISRKLKRNNGNSTPQQEVVVISGMPQEQEQILPDNYVTVPQTTHHIQHEVRPILICQICGDFFGEEQLKFFHHLKQHYEPHGTIIIENPVSDLVMDKMTNTCIVDNVATLPDSIVELSLENTVPKTMYQPMDKHILYTTSDKTLNFNSNKVQYSMASMDKDNVQESEKTDLYETLDKLEFHNCGKCSKPFRKHKQCEAHKRETNINPKLEDMGEFSEPEDLMAGIQVCVGDYETQLLPTLTVTENGHVTQEHHRHWTYVRNTNNGAYCPRPNDTQPLKVLKEEEVLQRIFEGEVASDNTFTDNMIPDNDHDHDTEHGHENVHDHNHENVHDHGHENVHDHGHENMHDHGHENLHDHGHENLRNHHIHEHNQESQHNHEDENSHEHENVHEHESMHVHSPEHEHSQESVNDRQIHKSVQNVNVNNMKQIQTMKDKSDIKTKGKLSCALCGREFVHRNSLVYHALTHVGKQHACSCGASFYTRTALNIHTRVHSGDKPYKCDECGRQFRQIGDLRYHKTSLHSDKKEFKCEFCGKEFARKYSLNVHRRIHTGEKNYQCHYCNKTFRTSSYRLAHMKTHTGDRPHKCDVCEKFFRSAFDMRRHAQIHEKMDNKYPQNRTVNKLKDSKKTKVEKDKRDDIEKESPNKTVKKIAVASTTTRLPILRKAKKKNEPNKKPTNVTVQNKNYDYEVFDAKHTEFGKFKEIYSHMDKDDNLVPYKSQIYKESDEKDMATLKRILRNQIDDNKPSYSSNRVENTDGKMQVYTHVEKSKDCPGAIVSQHVLNDIRQLDREVVERNDDITSNLWQC